MAYTVAQLEEMLASAREAAPAEDAPAIENTQDVKDVKDCKTVQCQYMLRNMKQCSREHPQC
jgi:hypothetical protein